MTKTAFSKEETIEALRNPQVGDYFTELMHYRMWVVKVTSTAVTYFEAVPPCTVPDDCTVMEVERSYFVDHFTKPHCWVRLIGRGEDMTGWLEGETVS